jgi:hypothetical protein
VLLHEATAGSAGLHPDLLVVLMSPDGDSPAQNLSGPSEEQHRGWNAEWQHLHSAGCQNRSVIEVPVVIRVAVSTPVNDATGCLFAAYAVSVNVPE